MHGNTFRSGCTDVEHRACTFKSPTPEMNILRVLSDADCGRKSREIAAIKINSVEDVTYSSSQGDGNSCQGGNHIGKDAIVCRENVYSSSVSSARSPTGNIYVFNMIIISIISRGN